MFYNIRTDLDKLQCASNITKIVNEVTTENQNTYRVLQLYLNTLYTISETDKNLSLVTSTFVLRLLSIIGYKPIIEECQNCKTKDDLNYFSFKDNGLKCKTCGKLDKGAIEITDTTKDAIRYIILANPKKLFSFNVPQESIKELQIISKIYLQEKLEKELESYQTSAKYIKEHRILMLKTVLTTAVQMLAYYTVPYWIYLAFGLNNSNIFDILTLQAVLYATVSGIPSPGSVGVSEGGFLGIFRNAFPETVISSAMLLSRGANFYLLILISAIVVVISTFRDRKEEKENVAEENKDEIEKPTNL